MLRLRLVVRAVSPLIVRVVEVTAVATLAMLDEVLAACLGWSGEDVSMFTVRAVSYSGNPLVGALPTRGVMVGSLGLRAGERFTWCPDLTSGWMVDVRVEAFSDADDVRVGVGVRCVSGRRAGPPVWCRSPAEFYGWEAEHNFGEFIDCLSGMIDARDRGDVVIGERLAGIAAWVVRDRFDKARVNIALGSLEVRSCVSSSRSA